MAKELTPLEFVTKLKDCVKEYNRKLIETRDDIDAAHFYSQSLKNFLIDHEKEISILSTLNFERSFFKWVKHYLLN